MSIISNAKEIADLIQKLGNAELYRKILDLQGEIINLTGENRSLKEENQELKRSLKISVQPRTNSFGHNPADAIDD